MMSNAMIERSVHHPTGMDVDSRTGNLYWTDSTLSVIYVAKLVLVTTHINFKM